MDERSRSSYQGALQGFIDNGINRILSTSPAVVVGGGDELTQRKLDLANRKLELQNEELEDLKKEVEQLKQGNTEGVEQLREKMEESMKTTLKEMEEREAKEKGQLREQLQTAKDHAEGLAQKISGMEGDLERKTSEVESLTGEVKSLLEQVAKNAKWRNDLALDSNLKEQVSALTLEGREMKVELEGKDEMIQELSMKLEALKQVQEAGAMEIEILKRELDHAQRKREELGANIQAHVQDILRAAGDILARKLIQVVEEDGDPSETGIQEEDDVPGSNMTGSETGTTPSTSIVGIAPYNLRGNRGRKRSYSEMVDGDGDSDPDAGLDSDSVALKGSSSGAAMPMPARGISPRDGVEHGEDPTRSIYCLCGKEWESYTKLRRHLRYFLIQSANPQKCDLCGTGLLKDIYGHLRTKTHLQNKKLANRRWKEEQVNSGDEREELEGGDEEMGAGDLMPNLTLQMEEEEGTSGEEGGNATKLQNPEN